MASIDVYNQEGQKVSTTELTAGLFDVEMQPEVVRQVVIAQQANSRRNLAHVKTRAEVRGGGRKPWRQKGTGRARHGSIRSPIWVGGGKSFGPRKTENYSQKVNKKVKRKALAMVLSEKARTNHLIVLDQLQLTEAKTKQFAGMLKKLPMTKPSALTVLPKKDETIVKAARNISKVKTILADSLNVVDILKYQYLVVPQAALTVIAKTFGSEKKAVTKDKE